MGNHATAKVKGLLNIENMIFSWMSDNASKKWSACLRSTQFMKNGSLHAGIKMSPYETVFGSRPRVGLEISSLPDVVLKSLRTEEELQEAVKSADCVNTSEQSVPRTA